MHRGQVDIGPATARALLDEQFPHWSDLPLRPMATSGTVNTLFRVGEQLTVRFPLLPLSREVLQSEADAARELAAVSPVPAPLPVALGEPGHGYPLPWSVQTWLPGRDALHDDPAASPGFAGDLADLLAALRQADTRGRRFTGKGRGGRLTDHDPWVAECLVRSEQLLDVPRLRSLWADLRILPEVDADAMTHGDLTPANLLVDDGRLAGVLDTGGFAAADPALDLVSV
ncbi:MAG: aminoglycoside phosphotransferase, partial [Frankiales bacterium]|nr:aminoglycoside phosphotransferase [Frankiales bacterium]